MPAAAVSLLLHGGFDEDKVRDACASLRTTLGVNPTFGLVFASPDYMEKAGDFLETVRLHARVSTLVGCSGQGLIGIREESEQRSGFSLLLVHLPGATVTPFTCVQSAVEEADGPRYWHKATGLAPADVRAWLVFADPFQFPIDPWLTAWNEAYPGVPIFGGLASSIPGETESWVFHNDKIVEGCIALGLTGNVRVRAVVSQGCKPIGEPLTVTQAERNVLYTLGSRPAYEVLNGVFQALTDEEKERAKGHLFAGLAMNEYVEDFKRGDFLVRNILGADPQSGAVAIGARLRVGQTLQYQLRDAQAASEDFHSLLSHARKETEEKPPVAGLLCSCNGRGLSLFKAPNHDAATVARFFPNLPLGGFFAHGEIGPVGERNFVHSYTASLALFSEG